MSDDEAIRAECEAAARAARANLMAGAMSGGSAAANAVTWAGGVVAALLVLGAIFR